MLLLACNVCASQLLFLLVVAIMTKVDDILASLRKALAREGQAWPVDGRRVAEAVAPPLSIVMELTCASYMYLLCFGMSRTVILLVV